VLISGIIYTVFVLFQRVCVQPPPSAVNITLPTFAAEHHAAAPLLLRAGTCCTAPNASLQLLINISCQQGTKQQTRRMLLLLLLINETDRWTPDHYTDPVLHIMQAASITSKLFDNYDK